MVDQEIVDRVSGPLLREFHLSYLRRELYNRGIDRPRYGKRIAGESE